jgi:hypothetical protein
MGFWRYLVERQDMGGKRQGVSDARTGAGEEDILERHARALLAGDHERARQLREHQPASLAALMLLAEELSSALQPVAVREATRERLRLALADAAGDGAGQRLVALVRDHGREAVGGVALAGTAYYLGRAAYRYYRRRQDSQPTGIAAG